MEIYKDESRDFKERAADLVSRMTLEEKISQVGNNAAAIPRLGLPRYDYWSEASHGFFGPFEVVPMDVTSYPVCLAMSQSWDTEKIKKVTTAISDECRAHHKVDGSELHMWCPTINLARDPRNGRSDENMGEDPYLAGKMAAAYIQGMQGDDEKYIKTVSTPKHYAMNSSENNRHSGSSFVDEATLREYYTKVFEYAIKEGKAQSIMTSYNRVNGVPSSANEKLLTTLLREEWGFDGVVTSDCGAVADMYVNPMFAGPEGLGHFYCKSLEEASALSLKSGTDLTCGGEHKKALMNALEQGLITEDVIDQAIIRALTTRFRLGLFDSEESVPYNAIGKEHIASKEMQDLSVNMANDTIVLLKNENDILPLDKNKLKKVLVIGPNALYRQLGGYSAGQSEIVDTPVNIMALDGIRNELEGSGVEVSYEKGWCTDAEFVDNESMLDILPGADTAEFMDAVSTVMDINPGFDNEEDNDMMAAMGGSSDGSMKRHVPEDPDYRADSDMLFARALKAAKDADVVIVVAGTDNKTASEEHDRETLALPYGQDEKIQQLAAVNPNTVVVLTTLGMVTGEFFDHVPAVVNAHFAGQAQGTAIANVLFGEVNPNAKLTATWYKDVNDLPNINDYGIKKQDTQSKKARTYMYFDGPVRYPFGYGLSYTTYQYANLKIDKDTYDANDTIQVSVDVSNTGKRDGREIVELYVKKEPVQRDNKPARQLKRFAKVQIPAGETKKVTFSLPLKEITFWSNFYQKMVVEDGSYEIEVGGSSADLPCKAEFSVTGSWDAAIYNVYATAEKYVMNAGDKSQVHTSAALEDTTHLCMCSYPPVYTSSDPSVATVDENGCVTAVSSGTATITASVTYEGKTESASVPVSVR